MSRALNPWCDRTLVKTPVWFTLVASKERFHQELKRMDLQRPTHWVSPGAAATCHQYEKDGFPTACIVCVDPSQAKDGVAMAATIVHEAVHVWQHIRERLGEYRPSIEFEAYSIGNISEELMRVYVRETVP